MRREINLFNNIINNLSLDVKSILSRIPDEYKEKVEEIRLRNGRPLNIYYQGKDLFISSNSLVSKNPKEGFIVGEKQINNTFQLITNYSIYAYTEEIKNGFITIKGGHRVGIGGKVIYGPNGIENIKDVSSLNIRIAREIKGVSDKILKYLVDESGNFYNTLIISPPQCGKTTLLRDLIRNLSNGNSKNKIKGFKIGLVDERSEIAGMYNGIPQNDVGIRTDILDGCLKYHGIMILIRSMSPEIIGVDEIGSSLDIEAIEEALRAGVSLIATVHGHGLQDLSNKANMDSIIREGIFKRYIVLDNSLGVGTIKEIINSQSNKIIYREKGI